MATRDGFVEMDKSEWVNKRHIVHCDIKPWVGKFRLCVYGQKRIAGAGNEFGKSWQTEQFTKCREFATENEAIEFTRKHVVGYNAYVF
jgi:hypothetical protein